MKQRLCSAGAPAPQSQAALVLSDLARLGRRMQQSLADMAAAPADSASLPLPMPAPSVAPAPSMDPAPVMGPSPAMGPLPMMGPAPAMGPAWSPSMAPSMSPMQAPTLAPGMAPAPGQRTLPPQQFDQIQHMQTQLHEQPVPTALPALGGVAKEKLYAVESSCRFATYVRSSVLKCTGQTRNQARLAMHCL